ncbi:unnamed protein product [Prunus armeniaca]
MSSPGPQSTPASTEPKHPSRHLLEKSKREAYLDLCVPLHKAAIKGDWDTAETILTDNPTLLSASITKGWQTALHIAAGARHIHFVEELVKMMDEEDLALQDNKENTALSFAAGAGAIEIANIMIQKNMFLPKIKTGEGLTPLFMAALLGRSEMAWYLYRKTYPTLKETNRNALFFSCIDTGLYDLAMKMLEDDTTLATAHNSNAETALHVLARRPLEFGGRSTSGMCSRLMNSLVSGIEDSYKSLKQTKALELVNCLWNQILKQDDDDVMRLITEPTEVLFDATRLGNYEFLSVLINAYPDLLWETDDENRTIFHVAVLYRHASIFNLVHETGSIKDIIVTYTDDENNNILHLAAKLAPQNQLNLVSGAALQMQRELVWFEGGAGGCSAFDLSCAREHMGTQINLVSMCSPQAQHVPAAEIQLMAGAPTTGLGIQSPPNCVIHIPSPQPKTPSLHLLEENNGEAREKYLRLCVPLHKAALRGDWKTAKSILRKDKKLLTASITKGWETALHIAAGARHVHFVKELVQMMDAEDLALQDNKQNTALSFAAAAGTVEIAEIMIRKNIFLPTIRGGEGMTPIYMAALLGQSEMVEYLYPKTYEIFDERDRNALFFTCVDTGLYDLAMKMLGNYTVLATVRNGENETALHVLARRPSEFASQSSGLWSRITNSFLKFAYKGNSKQTKALQLVQQLWEEILKLDDQVVMSLIKYPSQLLFDATRLGNFEFLAALLSAYPDLFWELDEKKQSIIHVAVLHRHASIFNLVHEIGFFKDFITAMSDDDDNNILHLAAKLAPQNQLNLVSGAALQMQRELVWFEEVKKIVQPLSTEMKNKNGKTPRELFTSEHKGLLHKGESWMKNTANSCMLVATIIATVVFSAAFSIPGGIADKTGAPNFVKETAFLIFAISDGVALFSSSTSMLMFLYILTSRYAENDFLKSLPLKLMAGLASLFISMTSMMIAFSTAFYLSCHYGLVLYFSQENI